MRRNKRSLIDGINKAKVKILELQLKVEQYQNELDTVDDQREGFFGNDGIDYLIGRPMAA